MALLRVEGFNSVTSADLAYLGTVINSPVISTSEQRNGNGCLELNSRNDYLDLDVNFASNQFIFGFAVKFSTTGDQDICQVGQASNHFLLLELEAGDIMLYRSSVLLGTASTTILADTWYYIELKGEVSSSSTIECILRVDGVTEITVPTGTYTSVSSTDATHVRFHHSSFSAIQIFIDDFYACDFSGSVNDDFLGICAVETILPNGNGYSSDFVGSDADSTDNYLLVDDPTTPDEDSTYVESPTVTEIDAYTFEDLVGDIGTIHGVEINTIAMKDDANTRTIKQITRPVSTNYEGSEHTLAENYTRYADTLDVNPADSNAWEEADINGSEFGIKVES